MALALPEVVEAAAPVPVTSEPVSESVVPSS